MRISAPHAIAGSWNSLLVLSTAFEIPQTDLDCPSGDFCPADLWILRKYSGGFGILHVKIKNLNDAVVDLDVSHGRPPYENKNKNGVKVNEPLRVALTEPGVHASMNSLNFSNIHG
jgi:hypothetical protein